MHFLKIHFLRCIIEVGCVKKRHAPRRIHKMQAILSVWEAPGHGRLFPCSQLPSVSLFTILNCSLSLCSLFATALCLFVHCSQLHSPCSLFSTATVSVLTVRSRTLSLCSLFSTALYLSDQCSQLPVYVFTVLNCTLSQ